MFRISALRRERRRVMFHRSCSKRTTGAPRGTAYDCRIFVCDAGISKRRFQTEVAKRRASKAAVIEERIPAKVLTFIDFLVRAWAHPIAISGRCCQSAFNRNPRSALQPAA